MNDIRFKSLEELYKKLLPAFKVKIKDLKRNNIKNIEPIDLWECLKVSSLQNRSNLTLAEMVDDIINISDGVVVDFVLSNRK